MPRTGPKYALARVQTRFSINRKDMDVVVREAKKQGKYVQDYLEELVLSNTRRVDLSEDDVAWVARRAEVEGVSRKEIVSRAIRGARRRIAASRRGV